MQRPLRWLLNTLTVLSLLLCVTTVVLWVTQPHFVISRNEPFVRAEEWSTRPVYGLLYGKLMVGRYCHSHQGSYHANVADACVPHWIATMTTAGLPALWAFRRIKSSANGTRAGYCHSCGYDLRATPDRCPECGNRITQVKA